MQKIGKAFGIIFLGLILLIGIPGYYFVKNFNLNKYKSYASQIVEEQLGRKFSIKGEASIGISLVPTLILEDVELANAPWASHPEMIKVKKLELKFALMPLFKKQIVVDKAILINPEVYLEVAKNGDANWDFPALKSNQMAAFENDGWLIKSAQAAKPEIQNKDKLKDLAGFAAQNVVIENGIVKYDNYQDNSQVNLIINDITLSIPSVEDPISLNAHVVYNEQNINFKSTLGSLSALIEGKEPFPVILNGTAYGTDLDVSGSVADMFGDLRFAAETNFYNPAGNLDAPETTLKALIEGDLKKIEADIHMLNVVNNVITGKVSADISGKIPFISANLRSNKIDLTTLASNRPMAWNLGLINIAHAANFVPATPIPYQDLKNLNAKADLKIGSLIIDKGIEAQNVNLIASLNNGVLNVNPLQLKFGGGEIDVQAVVNANSQSLTLKAVSKNMLLQNLHKEFVVTGPKDFGVLSGGNTDLYVNLNGGGADYRQMVQSLKGEAIFVLNNSELQTGGLDFMTGNFLTEVLNTINFKSSKGAKMNLNCAVVRADFANGRATFPKGIAFSAKQLSLTSDGYINLENDKINFSIHPFSGKVVDTNIAQALTSFFKIKGTVENPKITLDDKEALKAFVGIAATGGTAYLGSKLVMEPDSSPCYTALIGTPYAAMFPKPTGVGAVTKDVYQDTTKTIESDIKALKNTAKDFLSILKSGKGS